MKNKKQLTREQRYGIEVLLRAGKRQKEIAKLVEKDKSVLNRELKRNRHERGCSARLVQPYADERKECYRRKRRFTDSTRKKAVRELTREQRFPEQIVGRARRDGIPMVSHERICRFPFDEKTTQRKEC